MKEKNKKIGENFAVEVNSTVNRTSDYFGLLARVSRMLILIDIYLASQLFVKTKPNHFLNEKSIGERIYVDVSVGLDGKVSEIILSYLRNGKELVLSRLANTVDENGFQLLLQELTCLVNDTNVSISDNLQFKEVQANEISRIDLIRLLHIIWKIYRKSDKSLKISVISLDQNPEAVFKSEPPFRQWLDSDIEEDPRTAWFRLVTVHFEGKNHWKAYLLYGGQKELVYIKIADPKFLENLRSSKENSSNGLLAGDVFRGTYKIEEDQLLGRSLYVILVVGPINRADEMTQTEMFEQD